MEPESEGVSLANYFEEGRWLPEDQNRLLARIGWYHRTLSTIVNSLTEAAFVIERVAEPGAERRAPVAPRVSTGPRDLSYVTPPRSCPSHAGDHGLSLARQSWFP